MYDFTASKDKVSDNSFKYKDMYKRNPDVPSGIVPMSIADMEFRTAPEITEEVKKYLDTNVLGYTDASDGYLNSIVNWMRKRHNYHIKKEWIAPSDGVVTAIGDLILCMTAPGDGVVVFSPVYNPFKRAVKMKGRTLIDIPLLLDKDGYHIDYDAFLQAAKKNTTKLVIFCNPHNPIGKVWTGEELLKVYEICVENQLFIIDDEIHHDLIMPGYKHTVMANVAKDAGKHMAVCTAPSKSFNLAGLQTASIIIQNSEILDRFKASRLDGFRSVTNVLGMVACEAAYNYGEKWLDECIEVINRNAIYVSEFVKTNMPEIKIFPLEGTYLLWCDCRALRLEKSKLEEFMTEKAYIFADEGYIFGEEGTGFERLNIACSEQTVRETMDRLFKAYKRYIKK
ncbi:MAG: pyridoxal phosphate-dependent aminotransferase [Butyrivibrio sp.]|uniref:MalY/PatB family protein n=1 Tax=Butyrivibrio sp. TaxID=28121 RepID=UPI001AFE4F5E|nr:MalY/PatB family protein [Butyrivibrio sp.]MBO6242080.1 pyridoxal phosphate-dependent aminotransferase [Butyrivibrio sp.]